MAVDWASVPECPLSLVAISKTSFWEGSQRDSRRMAAQMRRR